MTVAHSCLRTEEKGRKGEEKTVFRANDYGPSHPRWMNVWGERVKSNSGKIGA